MGKEAFVLLTNGTMRTDGKAIPFVRDTYKEKLREVGLIPLDVHASMGSEEIRRRYERSIGVVITGGPDFNPAHYRKAQHIKTEPSDPERDIMELDIVRWTMEDATPMLGVCRGAQAAVIASGGELFQHIPALKKRSEAILHGVKRYEDLPTNPHEVQLENNSAAIEIFNAKAIHMPSGHHQAINPSRSGGYRITGWAPDGIAEFIEHPDLPWHRGTQFHPEAADGIAIFHHFAKATEAYRKQQKNRVYSFAS